MTKANPEDRRRALLAKVHIAKKELLAGDDEVYRFWVMEASKQRTDTAAKLSLTELESLVRRFKAYGWKDSCSAQIKALRAEVLKAAAANLGENWVSRLKGITKKVAGVERLEWVKTVARLERLLAVIRNIK